MSVSRVLPATFATAALIGVASCGAPGLPPAGPPEGQVDIGYGTQDEDKVSGAVSSLSDRDMGINRPLNLEELLRGRVPGLQIIRQGDRAVFRIRGGNPSLRNTAEQEPLFVVDGIQLNSDGARDALAGLTTRDVRQIDVLKDVASTAIYGMRGAGGVIVITTHR